MTQKYKRKLRNSRNTLGFLICLQLFFHPQSITWRQVTISLMLRLFLQIIEFRSMLPVKQIQHHQLNHLSLSFELMQFFLYSFVNFFSIHQFLSACHIFAHVSKSKRRSVKKNTTDYCNQDTNVQTQHCHSVVSLIMLNPSLWGGVNWPAQLWKWKVY